VAVCPAEAISLPVAGMAVAPAEAVAPAALLRLLAMRRSGREYTDTPVSRAHLEQLVQAASLAPSAKHFRPVTVHVLTDPAVLATVRAGMTAFYRRLLGLLQVPGLGWLLWRGLGLPDAWRWQVKASFQRLSELSDTGDPFFHGAGTLLLFTAPRHWHEGVGDAWIAAHQAVVMADALGVSTCYNGYLSRAAGADRRVHRALGLAPQDRLVAALTVGYPAVRYARPAPRETLPTQWR
jgi:nitroreductase